MRIAERARPVRDYLWQLDCARILVRSPAYRAVLVVVEVRLQDRIVSRSRATVTSVDGLGADVVTVGWYAARAGGVSHRCWLRSAC